MIDASVIPATSRWIRVVPGDGTVLVVVHRDKPDQGEECAVLTVANAKRLAEAVLPATRRFTTSASEDVLERCARAAFDAFWAEGTEYTEIEQAMFRSVAVAVLSEAAS